MLGASKWVKLYVLKYLLEIESQYPLFVNNVLPITAFPSPSVDIYIYIYIYIYPFTYIYIYVCVCVCVCVL